MFKVKDKKMGETYTVHSVKDGRNGFGQELVQFLLYKNGSWDWYIADYYSPVD